jgi:flagellar protein FliL
MAKAAKMDFNPGGKMAEEESDEGGGGRRKKLIIIVLALLLLIGGGIGAYLLVFKPETEVPEKQARTGDEFAEEVERARTTDALERAEKPEYWSFREPKEADGGDYIVNLIDGRNFLRVRLVAEIEEGDEKVKAYLNNRRPLLDDMIITRLAALDSEAARDPRTHERLKTDLKRKVNSIFSADFLKSYGGKGNPVKRILITKIILN